MPPVVTSVQVDLGAKPERVWPLIADTDRMNRLFAKPVGYRPIEAAPGTSARTPSRFVGETRAAGFRLTYEEEPFEWIEGERFAVRRTMRGGPVSSYALTLRLSPSPVRTGGTRVDVRLDVAPRLAFLRPIAWLESRRAVTRIAAAAEAIDRHLREGGKSPFTEPVSPCDARALDAGVKALAAAGVDADLAARLGDHLRRAPDADLVRVRPFALADAWQEDRRTLLRALLHAVRAGLFELRWALVCPSCRTASELEATLDAIGSAGHCQLCDVTFELDLDRAVEATFVPHAAVRQVPEQLFCIGGPARTPHVVAQVNLRPDETRAVAGPRTAGRHRLFARGGAIARIEVDDEGPPVAEVTLTGDGFVPADVHVGPAAEVRIRNQTPDALHVKIERLAYADDAATAHLLATEHEFRRLFSGDLLKRGTPLKVSRVAILFSDLTGSTALYSTVGDAAAFRLVDDHFDVVRGAIEAKGGVVVKTMGDAVMAAFPEGRGAMQAAAAVLDAFEAFRAASPHGAQVGIKLGIFEGPCYVVTANERLDYFGQTVNVAARVQHLASSGELVVGRDTHAACAGELPALRSVETLDARVKGVDAPLALVRLRLLS